MAMAIHDWPGLARQMFEHTIPGGWVEIVDHGYREVWCDDGSAPADSKMRIFMQKMSASLEAAGLNPDVDTEYFKKLLGDAGFVDVQVWASRVGHLVAVNDDDGRGFADGYFLIDAVRCLGQGQEV